MATLGGPPGAQYQGGYAANGPQQRYAYQVAGPGFPHPYHPIPQVFPNVTFDQRAFHNPFQAPQPPQVPVFGGGLGAGPAAYAGGGAGGGPGFPQAQNPPFLAQHNGNPYATVPQFQQLSGPPFAGASGALVVGTSTRQHVTDVNGNLRGTNTSNAQVKVNKIASVIRLCGDNEQLLGYIKDGVSCKTDIAVSSFWASAARSQNASQVGGLATPAMRNYQVFLDSKLTSHFLEGQWGEGKLSLIHFLDRNVSEKKITTSEIIQGLSNWSETCAAFFHTADYNLLSRGLIAKVKNDWSTVQVQPELLLYLVNSVMQEFYQVLRETQTLPGGGYLQIRGAYDDPVSGSISVITVMNDIVARQLELSPMIEMQWKKSQQFATAAGSVGFDGDADSQSSEDGPTVRKRKSRGSKRDAKSKSPSKSSAIEEKEKERSSTPPLPPPTSHKQQEICVYNYLSQSGYDVECNVEECSREHVKQSSKNAKTLLKRLADQPKTKNPQLNQLVLQHLESKRVDPKNWASAASADEHKVKTRGGTGGGRGKEKK